MEVMAVHINTTPNTNRSVAGIDQVLTMNPIIEIISTITEKSPIFPTDFADCAIICVAYIDQTAPCGNQVSDINTATAMVMFTLSKHRSYLTAKKSKVAHSD